MVFPREACFLSSVSIFSVSEAGRRRSGAHLINVFPWAIQTTEVTRVRPSICRRFSRPLPSRQKYTRSPASQ
eukprot:5714593-Pyramimonas_sp.AAC.1